MWSGQFIKTMRVETGKNAIDYIYNTRLNRGEYVDVPFPNQYQYIAAQWITIQEITNSMCGTITSFYDILWSLSPPDPAKVRILLPNAYIFFKQFIFIIYPSLFSSPFHKGQVIILCGISNCHIVCTF